MFTETQRILAHQKGDKCCNLMGRHCRTTNSNTIGFENRNRLQLAGEREWGKKGSEMIDFRRGEQGYFVDFVSLAPLPSSPSWTRSYVPSCLFFTSPPLDSCYFQLFSAPNHVVRRGFTAKDNELGGNWRKRRSGEVKRPKKDIFGGHS